MFVTDFLLCSPTLLSNNFRAVLTTALFVAFKVAQPRECARHHHTCMFMFLPAVARWMNVSSLQLHDTGYNSHPRFSDGHGVKIMTKKMAKTKTQKCEKTFRTAIRQAVVRHLSMLVKMQIQSMRSASGHSPTQFASRTWRSPWSSSKIILPAQARRLQQA